MASLGAPAAPVSCPHAQECAGCPLIALPYADQLLHKGRRIDTALARYVALGSVRAEPVVGAETLVAYRTRAKLIVDSTGKLGLYAKSGGHRVVDVPGCRVLAPVLERVASHLRSRIARADRSPGDLEPFDPTGRGWLRAVDLREVHEKDGPRVLVTFVGDRSRIAETDPIARAAANLMNAVPDVIGVALNFHVGENPQVLGPQTVSLCGVTAAHDRIGTSVHLATFGSFVQAHRAQAARMHDWLTSALGVAAPHNPNRRVLDLYGGSGAIALSLADAGASVHLIEAFGPAAHQARTAAEERGLDVSVECADASVALQRLCAVGARFDAAVLNPPRRGASPSAREGLARLGAKVLAYVSCEPDTLARDLDHFALLGYGSAQLRPLDMIPLTDEVETIAILRPEVPPAAVVVYEDDEALILQKGPHEPTTAQGDVPSLLLRARRLPGAGGCVPVTRLDVSVSGLVVFVRDPALLPKWEAALAMPSTRVAYLALVRGVTSSKGTIARALSEDGALRAARTRYRRLAIAAGQSLLHVVPDGGRAHQARRHLSAIGHPIIGDDRHGHDATNRYFTEKNTLDRPFLHCARLEFDPPAGGGRRVAQAPLSGDLKTVLDRMGVPATLRL